MQDTEAALDGRDWLAGETYSLADIGLVPYLLRLDHLGLAGMWSDKSGVAAWYERVRQRPSYQTAVVEWLVPAAVTGMNEAGKLAWPRVREILAS